jgi:outer membrane protein
MIDRRAIEALPLVAFSLLLASSPVVGASRGGDNGVLDLASAVSRALDTAPATRAGRKRVEAQKQATAGARGRLYPQLSADASASYSEFETSDSRFNPRTFAFEQSTQEVEQTSNSLGVSVEQTIYNREVFKRIDRARDQTQQARARLQARRQDVIKRVAETYFKVLRQRESVSLARSELKFLRLRVEQLRERLDRGLASQVDVLDARVRKEEVEARLAKARNASDEAAIQLERLVGTSFDALRAADVEGIDAGGGPSDQQIQRWADQARANSPEVAVAEARADVREQAVAVRRSQYYPRLSLQARYSDTDRTDQVVSGEQKRVALQLNVPLYTGGQTAAGVDEAKAREAAARARLNDARRKGMLDARQIANELRSAARQVSVQQRALETARKQTQATERSYQQGLRNQVDVLEARARVFEIRRELTNAVYDRLIARVKLESLIGALSIDRARRLERDHLSETLRMNRVANGGVERDARGSTTGAAPSPLDGRR